MTGDLEFNISVDLEQYFNTIVIMIAYVWVCVRR